MTASCGCSRTPSRKTTSRTPPSDYAGLHLTDEERTELFEQVHDDPKAAIPRLRALLEESPDLPVLHNWLTTAYQSAGDDEAAAKVAEANYARNPGYLFAKLNVAQFALARGELDRFREVFVGKFDLKLLYPHRDVFHISEFVGFASLMIQYHVRVDELERAELLLEALEQIAPDAPATQSSRKVLEHWGLLRLMEEAKERLLFPRAKRPRHPKP